MPGRDGTGPVGMGPMKGHGGGFCGGYGYPAYAAGYVRKGCCHYYGLPHHWGFYPCNIEEEAKVLEARAEFLQRHLDAIKRRLKDLKNRDEGGDN
ncbi:DUF5320 domain-containing protein [Caldanaerobius polysaccharolyticus]|uniref:DUF5320 domain-containing protein n=1 Tax=Caldanaerobius polysaccharolyticus TaxID=44256 RepID=UPI00047E8C4D|nr:DUF5320 domain-containing protein [Caldanaerobius polysaccharolyticus]